MKYLFGFFHVLFFGFFIFGFLDLNVFGHFREVVVDIFGLYFPDEAKEIVNVFGDLQTIGVNRLLDVLKLRFAVLRRPVQKGAHVDEKSPMLAKAHESGDDVGSQIRNQFLRIRARVLFDSEHLLRGPPDLGLALVSLHYNFSMRVD